MASNGKLLMISDLEGCAEYDNANKVNILQTTILCQDSTFNALIQFLKENQNNKIAFLGDYFDKGPYVIKSINRITELKKNFGDRVHIILGNRDVNKLRFIYEFDIEKQTFTDMENLFFSKTIIDEIINQKDPFEKLKLILKNTMGAGPPAYDPTKNIALQIDEFETDEKYLAELLVSVFNKDTGKKINNKVLTKENEEFIENCHYLYENSKIVHYDPHFKVLLSHAGGFTKENDFILSDTSYYDTILKEIEKDPIAKENYFVKILDTQKKLTKVPEQANEEKSLEEVLNFHNNLLKKSLKFDDKDMPSKEFILLQAMGLSGKPNYYSFIASCGLNGGCTLDFNINPELISKMKIKGIKFVASGHQPHCTTVPLIYKQDEVVFIANDTSNGYRPESATRTLSLKNIPLSFIEIKNDGTFECGVCAIEPKIDYLVGEIKVIGMKFIKASDDNNEIKGLSKDGKIDNYYQKLIKSYANLNDIPDVSTVKTIIKSDGMFTPLSMVGGKRKSKKNSKKSRRRSKSGKRTHKCLHGCKHR